MTRVSARITRLGMMASMPQALQPEPIPGRSVNPIPGSMATLIPGSMATPIPSLTTQPLLPSPAVRPTVVTP